MVGSGEWKCPSAGDLVGFCKCLLMVARKAASERRTPELGNGAGAREFVARREASKLFLEVEKYSSTQRYRDSPRGCSLGKNKEATLVLKTAES